MYRVVGLASLIVLLLAAASNVGALGVCSGAEIPLVVGAGYPGQWDIPIQSDPASCVLTVMQVSGVAVSSTPVVAEVGPAETVYVPVQITNLGNGPDNFLLETVDPAGWGVAIILDDDADGIHDESENNATATCEIAADGRAYCFARVTMPALPELAGTVTFSATSLVDMNRIASANLSISGMEAPALQVTSPTSEPIFARNSSHLHLGGTATDNTGIASVTWANMTTGATGLCAVNGANWSGVVVLAAGENTILVAATDSRALVATKVLGVTYIESAPGDAWTGLSMVSMPIIPDKTDPLEQTGFDRTYWLTFDAGVQDYARYPDARSMLLPAEDTPLRGFWTHFAGVAAKPVGMIPRQDQPVRVHLKPGWNLVGAPFIQPVSYNVDRISVQRAGQEPQSLRNSAATVASIAWGWRQEPANPDTGAYFLVCDPTLLPGGIGQLDPWRGYWIHASAECDLIFPPPGQ